MKPRITAVLAAAALSFATLLTGCGSSTQANPGSLTTSATAMDTSALVSALVTTFGVDEASARTAVAQAVQEGSVRPDGQGSAGTGQAPGAMPSGAPGGSGGAGGTGTAPSAMPSAPGGQQGGAPGAGASGAPGSGASGAPQRQGGDRMATRIAASIASALNLDEAKVLVVVEANLPTQPSGTSTS